MSRLARRALSAALAVSAAFGAAGSLAQTKYRAEIAKRRTASTISRPAISERRLRRRLRLRGA